MDTTHTTQKANAIFVRVTPIIATDWLSLNYEGQRKLRRATVSRYAREMMQGRWIGDNGQCIVFSSDGWLVDGQHRLHAVIKSGCDVEMLVIHSSRTAEEIMSTIDVGDKRSAHQLYAGPNATVICAMAKTWLCLIYGELGVSSSIRGTLVTDGGVIAPSVSEVLEYVEEHEDELQADFKLANRMYSSNNSGASLKACHSLVVLARFCQLDDKLEEFCSDFASAMPRIETVAYLKRYFFNLRSKRGCKPDISLELDALLRAYDAVREGRTCKAYNRQSYLSIEKWNSFVAARRVLL